jgi:O-antigen ligase
MSSSGPKFSTALLVVVSLIWGGGLCLPGNDSTIQFLGPLVFIAVALLTPSFRLNASQDFTIAYTIFCFLALIPACLKSLFDGKLYAYLLLLPVIICYSALPKESRRAIGISLCVSGIIFGLTSLMQFGASADLVDDSSIRLGGNKNPNSIAYIVGMSSVFIGSITGNMWQKACIFVLAFIPIIATKSKTGLGLFLVGYILILLQNQKSKISAFFIFCVVLLATFLLFSFQVDAIESFFQLDESRSLSDGTGRLDGWIFLLDRYSSNDILSILFGGGAGSSKIAVQAFNSNAHNSWILILFDFGIIGLLLQLSLVILALSRRTYFLLAPVIVAGLIESATEVNYVGLGNVGSILFVFALYELSERRMGSQLIRT